MSAENGKKYFVSVYGTDKIGLSADSPMSYETAMKKVYSDGDEVLLRCGEEFVGPVAFKTDVKNSDAEHRVKISCYGEGALPKISASVDVEDPDVFEKFSHNIYVADFRGDDKTHADINNIGYFRDGEGRRYCSSRDYMTGLKENFDYFFDKERLFVYCDENPIIKLGKLRFVYRECLVRMYSNSEFCNLNICDTGGHGMIKAEDICENVYIHDCVINDCGGSILCFSETDEPTRYGNGIEFYNGGTSNILIENNLIRDCYDVAFTMQGHIATYDTVTVRHNVFITNNQSSEIWTMADLENGVKNYLYYENLSFAEGRGWGHTSRPDGKANTEILFYHYHSPILQMKCYGNIMFDPYRLYWWPIKETLYKFIDGVQSFENKIFAREDIYSINWEKDDDILGALQNGYKKDFDSGLTVISDISYYAEMMEIAKVSNDIEEIRSAARKYKILD